MTANKKYTALAIVFLASLGTAAFFHYFPVTIVGDLAGIPAIAALFAALFQLSRDSIAFDRSIRLEEAKNRFTVGATSHMADVAFDKHVQFCEEYTAEVYRTLTFLFKKGPHADVLQNANALMDIRTKWSVWLTPEIETQLEKFEGALRTIGANAWLLGELRADDDRTDAVREAFATFAAVMGWETWKGKAVTRDLAAEKVVEELRRVLGIGELTRLRSELVKRATDNLR
jgi:hypothetical protein